MPRWLPSGPLGGDLGGRYGHPSNSQDGNRRGCQVAGIEERAPWDEARALQRQAALLLDRLGRHEPHVAQIASASVVSFFCRLT
jgi:hypothetical protein